MYICREVDIYAGLCFAHRHLNEHPPRFIESFWKVLNGSTLERFFANVRAHYKFAKRDHSNAKKTLETLCELFTSACRAEREVEEQKLRKWAWQNYPPGDPINSAWHPTINYECEWINKMEESRRAHKRPYSHAEDQASIVKNALIDTEAYKIDAQMREGILFCTRVHDFYCLIPTAIDYDELRRRTKKDLW